MNGQALYPVVTDDCGRLPPIGPFLFFITLAALAMLLSVQFSPWNAP